MKKLLLLITLSLSTFSVAAQELPQTRFELLDIIFEFKSETYKHLILEELKSEALTDAKRAFYQNALVDLYEGLYQLDSSVYYAQKVESFWKNREIKDDERDYFGQFLLKNSIPRSNRDLLNQSLDSALLFLENTEDRLLAEVERYSYTSVFENPKEYFAIQNELLSRTDLPDNIRGEVLLKTSVDLQSMNEYDSSIMFLKQMDELNINSYFRTFQQYYIAMNLMSLGRSNEARVNIENIRVLAEEQNNFPELAQVYHNVVSNILMENDRYDSLVYHQLKQIEIVESTSNSADYLCVAYSDLSSSYSRLGNLKKAEEAILHALEITPSYRPSRMGTFRSELINLLLSLAEDAEGNERRDYLKRIDESMSIQSQNILKYDLADLQLNLDLSKSAYLLLTERYRSAEVLLKAALNTTKSDNRRISIFNAYRYLTSAYNEQGKYTLGVQSGNEALKYTGRTDLKIPVHQLLIEAYIGKGMTQEALNEFEVLNDLKALESKKETTLLLAEFEAKKDLVEQRLKNKSLAIEQEAKATLIERQQYIIYIVVLSALIIVVALLRLKAVHRRNLALLKDREQSSLELQSTNTELSDIVVNLQDAENKNQELLSELSIKLNRIFNGVKGLRSFLPEVGKLNTEQTKYFNRTTEILASEEASLNALISLNSVLGDHEIEIRRVSLSDTIKSVRDKAHNILHLNQVSLEVDIEESLVFLADRELIEMTIISLIQHSLSQDLKDKKLKLSVTANEGLQMGFEFRGGPVSKEVIDRWLSKITSDQGGYLSKVEQLKDLMDGSLQYISIGDLHKIRLNLNLIEVKSSAGKSGEVDELEIDSVYNRVVDYLVKEDGLSNSDLTLVGLSQAISISSRRISFVINTRERTNFSKFLSRLRVEKVKEILDGGIHAHLNIAGIGYEAGFNSKSTFFSSFKEFVGCTPKEYMNENDGQQTA